ncbi:MAG: SprB repeat-containing protein [Candidatus Paceibacterota bacterium]
MMFKKNLVQLVIGLAVGVAIFWPTPPQTPKMVESQSIVPAAVAVPEKQKMATVSAPVKMQEVKNFFTVQLDDTLACTAESFFDTLIVTSITRIKPTCGQCDGYVTWYIGGYFNINDIYYLDLEWLSDSMDSSGNSTPVFIKHDTLTGAELLAMNRRYKVDSLCEGYYWLHVRRDAYGLEIDPETLVEKKDDFNLPCNLCIPVQTTINATTCNPDSAGIKTIIYQAANGCDSTVTTIVTLLQSSDTTLNLTTCDPAQADTFVQHLTNAAGCDSTVTTIVTLLPAQDTTSYVPTCDPSLDGKLKVVISWPPTPQHPCGLWDSVYYQYKPLVIMLDTLSVTCPPLGGADGEISIVVVEGTAPFSYLWGSGATSATCSGLAPGTYHATVTDANGCEETLEATLAAPVCINPDTVLVNIPTCNPDLVGVTIDSTNLDSIVITTIYLDSTLNPMIELVEFNHPTTMDNGSILVNATGGTPGYGFLWNTGETSPSLGNLEGGIYSVTVTDAAGCVDSLRVPLCSFWASSTETGKAIIHYGPADNELIDMYGGEVGTLIVTKINGQKLLEEEINLREEITRTIITDYKGVAVATIMLPNGKVLVCKFTIL